VDYTGDGRKDIRGSLPDAFASAANYLSDMGGKPGQICGRIVTGRDVEHEPLSREEAVQMQQILNRLGFDAGPEDGLPGSRTRSAVRAFQKEHSLPPDGYPSPALQKRLRALEATIS